MFSAVSNLGAGGLEDVSLSDTANSVLYAMFAVTGLVSGGIANGVYQLRWHLHPNGSHAVRQCSVLA